MMVAIINPGELRVELTLERMEQVPDAIGGFSENWLAVGLLFAMVEPLSARSRFGADQTLEDVSHRITIRHRADVTSGMRLRRGDRLFEVVTAHDPDETGRYLVLRAREKGR